MKADLYLEGSITILLIDLQIVLSDEWNLLVGSLST